jgi:hypothetical protein
VLTAASQLFRPDPVSLQYTHTFSARGLNICKRIIRSENKIFSTLTLFGGIAMRWTRYSKQDRLRLMIFGDRDTTDTTSETSSSKILQFMHEGYLNLSTDMAISHVRHFLRPCQPIGEALQSVLLTLDEVEN